MRCKSIGLTTRGRFPSLELLNSPDDPLDHRVVPVITTKLRVPVGGHHLEDTIPDIEHGDVEGSTTKVINGDLLVAGFLSSP